MVLKFSEVYFNSLNDKVFDVMLGDTTVIRKLDVFGKVGKATAYDEFIEFEVKENKVYIDVNNLLSNNFRTKKHLIPY